MLQRGSGSGLLLFDPPRDAEPSAQGEAEPADSNGDTADSAKPSVLNKLQKWADYPAVGQPVQPTNFLPMKTPMSCEILANWSLPAPPRHSLTIPELLSVQGAAGHQVGMIIDLANHECLYADDLPPSLEYAHVQLVAKVLPPLEAIDEVQHVAGEFWSRHPDRFVAIHCAYGFNRTGFVVCSYLCQACGMSVTQALDSFAQARPPGVKHGKFVDALYERYGNGAAAPAADAAPDSQSTGCIAAAPSAPDTPSVLAAAAAVAAEFVEASTGRVALSRRAVSSHAPSPFLPGGQGLILTRTVPHRLSLEGAAVGSPSALSAPITISRRTSLAAPAAVPASNGGPVPQAGCGDVEAGSSYVPHMAGDVMQLGGHYRRGSEDVSDFTAMALHLDKSSSMRKETSLGLARALHEDFGVHDSTPQRTSPRCKQVRPDEEDPCDDGSHAGQEGAAASGCSAPSDEPAASAFAAPAEQQAEREGEACATPAPHPPPDSPEGSVSEQPQPAGALEGGGACQDASPTGCHGAEHGQQLPPLHRPSPLAAAPAAAAPVSTGRSAAPSALSSSSQKWGMVRNMSVDSDNHSLGFGAREALISLRAGGWGSSMQIHDSVGNPPGSEMSGALSELNLSDWEGGGPPTGHAAAGPAGQRRRRQPGGCRMS